MPFTTLRSIDVFARFFAETLENCVAQAEMANLGNIVMPDGLARTPVPQLEISAVLKQMQYSCMHTTLHRAPGGRALGRANNLQYL